MKDTWISMKFIVFFIFLSKFAASAGPLCHSKQRDLLLEFKNEFQATPEHFCSLTSDGLCSAKHWEKEEDCCSWEGIICDAKSGEVIELNASCCFQGHFNSNSSLFKLQSLRSLNLAYNNFNSSPLPTQFSKLTELKQLNLSLSYFSGQILTEFLQLTKLVFLDLSFNSLLSFQKSFFTILAQNLTNLEELNLNMVNISSEIPQNISNLSSLRSLNLYDCSLLGKLPPDFFLFPNIQSISLGSNKNLEGSLPEFHGNKFLSILDLSSTSLSGNILDSITKLEQLTILRLQYSKFSGKIPSSIGNLSYLTTLDLSQNQLSGVIPSSIGYLSNLTTLKLSNNSFTGLIPSSIGNLSLLTNLPFAANNFSGQIPSSLGNLFHLTTIDLSYNQFSGQIPSSFGKLNQLTSLRLLSNKLSGNFPTELLNLTELSNLEISENQLTGTLPLNMSSLSKLESFAAFGNAFTGKLPSSLFNIPNLTSIYLSDNQLNGHLEFGNISSPSKLQWLYIGRNNFRGSIPRSVSRFNNLISLDLSNLNTETTVDFCSFSQLKSLKDLSLSNLNSTTVIDLNSILSCLSSLVQLVLSGNHMSNINESSVLDPPSQSMISTLRLSSCSITKFPKFIQNHQNLATLDLSDNNITDQVPAWLWRLPLLQFVDLSENTAISFERSSDNFSSNPFPAEKLSSISDLPSPLTVLILSSSNITGVPEFIKRHRSITSINLSNNKIKGQVPGWLWTLPNLMHLDLSNNLFIGLEGSMNPGAFSFPNSSMKFLLGSKNYFSGKIPSFICVLSSLNTLDLSDNNFNGPIPRCFENIKDTLAVLNLRQNRLNGSLPAAVFDSLRSLDVGHNNLVGKLPRSLIHCSSLEVLNIEGNKFNDAFPFWLSSLQNLQFIQKRRGKDFGSFLLSE